MRMKFDGKELSDVIYDDLGVGNLFLLKYEPGSGGEFFMKQFFSEKEETSNNILITTNETSGDITRVLSDNEMSDVGEIVDLHSLLEEQLEDVIKRDKFVEDGILVTDLLDLASNDAGKDTREPLDMRIMAKITSKARKQITPFRFVIDDLKDIVDICSEEELKMRLLILKNSLRKNRGIGILGTLHNDIEIGKIGSVFDGIIRMENRKEGDEIARFFIIEHLKNNLSVPKYMKISEEGNIPRAVSIN
jgi:KaiC/GvpD/RAD55 family RecA-like ATPase